MNLLRYKRVSAQKVASELAKELKWDWKQEEQVKEYLENEYTIVSFEREVKSNLLWRLSAPLLLVYFIILFVGMLPKWLATGKSHYDYEGIFLRVLHYWYKKVDF